MADFVMNTDGEFGGQIVQELSERFTKPSPFAEVYKQWGDRLLFMDSNEVPGAFQMNTTWYINAPDFRPLPYHEDHCNYKKAISLYEQEERENGEHYLISYWKARGYSEKGKSFVKAKKNIV